MGMNQTPGCIILQMENQLQSVISSIQRAAGPALVWLGPKVLVLGSARC